MLEEALTHTSYVNERKQGRPAHNERLEFLGDAVLSLVMTEYLARHFSDYSEGTLSKLKAVLVSASSLATVARQIELGQYLRLGRGEERSKGREKDSLLADALEAVIAAVHLDAGYEASRVVTLKLFAEPLQAVSKQAAVPGGGDYKTRLQEWSQKRYDRLPRYVTEKETGPDHHKSFEVEVWVEDETLGRGTGRSKKEAEQAAAKDALERMSRP